jgi:hypothetical protein
VQPWDAYIKRVRSQCADSGPVLTDRPPNALHAFFLLRVSTNKHELSRSKRNHITVYVAHQDHLRFEWRTELQCTRSPRQVAKQCRITFG